MRKVIGILLTVVCCCSVNAQEYNQINEDGTITTADQRRSDSIQSQHKETHRGLKVWTIDERFGDRTPAEPDTVQYLFMNSIFTTGMRGEYNTTGNLGAARQNRIFIDRHEQGHFVFTQPYDYFIQPVGTFHFTNTYTPITNLTFNTCGNRTNGEDHLKAIFAVNAGKELGMGFKFDYLYGRGYYSDNSSALFDYTMFGSYVGDRYQAHLLMSLNHQKQAENGGITNDYYITHPENFGTSYSENEIPTMLTSNWNRNDNQHIFLSHRYSIGFHREVPMTQEEIEAKRFAMAAQAENDAAKAKEEARKKARKEGMEFDEEEYEQQLQEQRALTRPDATAAVPTDTVWTKREYVPVTSFIHTAQFDNYKRIYQAYATPDNYYAQDYYVPTTFTGDSIKDLTRHYELKNTFAIAMLEGFNKWAKMGIKAFISHSLRHFTMPDSDGNETTWNEQGVAVGGQISKKEGETLHYNVTGEFGIVGEDAGNISIDGRVDVNFPLLGDTVQLAASGFFHHVKPTFYYRHYHSRHFWWDDDGLNMITHTRVQGLFSLQRTRTQLRVAVDNITNHTYFATNYSVNEDNLRLGNEVFVRQGKTNVLTAQLSQDFRLGPLCLDAVVTYQKSTDEDVLPLPALNVYGNLYLDFLIAKVLKCHLGADIRWFTKYHAPDFVPGIAQYAVQENADSRVDIGNYPIVNVYANFHLKQARFFVMMSHVNYTAGNYFLAPHYPLNQRILRFGVSWNFFN